MCIRDSDSPVQIDSERVSVNEYCFETGDHSIYIKEKYIHSIFLLDGKVSVDGLEYSPGTFFKIQNEKNFKVIVLDKAKFFEIISPVKPSYSTYF